MGSPSIPAQPAAPDYAAANREGIVADIENLPLRRQIDAAARLGQKITYTDPKTGEQKTADFTGAGDAAYAKQMADLAGSSNAQVQRDQLKLRQELGVANAQQTAAEIEAADPAGYATRGDITNRVRAELNMGPATVQPSAGVRGAAGRINTLAGQAPGTDGRINEVYDQVNGTFRTAVDDGGQEAVLRNLNSFADQRLGGVAQDAESANRLRALDRQANALPTEMRDATTEQMQGTALGRALEDFKLGGKLNASELRQVTDNVRAGQAARGNYLGDAAAVAEAVEQSSASDAKAQQRLQNLLTVQNQVFGQNDALRNESQAARLARLGQMSNSQATAFGQNAALRGENRDAAAQYIGARAGLGQQQFDNSTALRNEQRGAIGTRANLLAGLANNDTANRNANFGLGLNAAQAAMGAATTQAGDERASRQEGFGYDQQRLSNANSVALGAPITNQFGSLGGAQQGSVGYNPVAFQGGVNTNANAGANSAQFAQGNYGTQAQMWSKSADIAAQGNPWMSLIGNVAGAAAGAMI
jgi:hypothetical protein